MCGAPAQDKAGLDGVDLSKVTVIQGRVVRSGDPVAGAYVRLLDATGEFTAEVQTSAEGRYRFFAAPGEWMVRVLAPGATVEQRLAAEAGLNEAELSLA
ncbi:MAG: DUF1416 domain-containing protein [Geodermatophilaceae bacterium]|nr:DUF1416 domain-containing protein [Geodermatophilaceae bacterium]